MSDMMTFPATVEEFMELYKIVDDEKVYTNGADLVPIFRMMQWFEHVSATDKNVGINDDCISRKQAIDVAKNSCFIMRGVRSGRSVTEDAVNATKRIIVDGLHALPSVQLGTNLTEEYARAVRNWLVNYQVKCADLAGRYTPYEVLGWIVSDWRKDNGIW